MKLVPPRWKVRPLNSEKAEVPGTIAMATMRIDLRIDWQDHNQDKVVQESVDLPNLGKGCVMMYEEVAGRR
jgi:hypothetical protein